MMDLLQIWERDKWTKTVIRAEGGEEKIVYLIGGDKMCAPLTGMGGEDDIVHRGHIRSDSDGNTDWSDSDGNSD